MKKLLLSLTIAAVTLSLPVVFAQGKGKGQGKGGSQRQGESVTPADDKVKQKDRDRDEESEDAARGRDKGKSQQHRDEVNIYFGNQTRTIQDYYRPRQGSLPPGLEKHLQRNGTLPPGLQKKLQPFPIELERQLPPIPAGYARHVVGSQAIVLDKRTNKVMDIVDLAVR